MASGMAILPCQCHSVDRPFPQPGGSTSLPQPWASCARAGGWLQAHLQGQSSCTASLALLLGVSVGDGSRPALPWTRPVPSGAMFFGILGHVFMSCCLNGGQLTAPVLQSRTAAQPPCHLQAPGSSGEDSGGCGACSMETVTWELTLPEEVA